MTDYFGSSQFENNQNQPNTSAQSGDADRNNSHAHVSLSQIVKLTRKEDGLVIHRQKINSLTTIGLVMSVEEVTTKNVYQINDFTVDSPIDVQLWKNEKDDGQTFEPPPIMEKTYIRVIGQVRYDDRKPFIVAFKVEPIVNPNEIATHFLEVIADSLVLEKRKNATLNKSDMETSHMDLGNESNQYEKSGFNEMQRTVLTILEKYGTVGCGLKRDEIKSYTRGVNPAAVDEALDFLANEGHIFSTSDEDTFKCTGS